LTGRYHHAVNLAALETWLLALDRSRYHLAVLLWIALSAATVMVYKDHPLSMDEYSALFQAKVFAAGALHGTFPPELLDHLIPREFQNHFLMVNRSSGAVFSAYWPGFSILLTPFVWLGIPWACNPLIVTLSLLLIVRLTRDLTGSSVAAGWALLLSLASSAFLINGITYYSMPAHLLFNLAFAWLLLVPSPRRLIAAGMVGGYAAVLHNPFPHFVFCLPWLLWLLCRKERRWRNLLFLGLGYSVVILPLGLGWRLWLLETIRVGVPAIPVQELATSAMPTSFFDNAVHVFRAYTGFLSWPDELLIYKRLGGVTKLWLWASPLLLLLAWVGGRNEKQMGLRLLGLSALVTFFAFFFVRFDQGHGWGYRYFHSAWGVLPIFAALGAMKLVEREGTVVRAQLLVLTLFSLTALNALRLVQVNDFMIQHLAQFPPRLEGGKRIVLHNGRGYYAYDLIQNDPWLRGNEIVLLYGDEAERKKLLERFGDGLILQENRYGMAFLVDNFEAPKP
ncbi:MAG TPA: hypothetical protein PLW86_03205, partial [Rhodocyclaceae bacterium]|nr:hypothetical protein [Rhodocyclaceae bacterium]